MYNTLHVTAHINHNNNFNDKNTQLNNTPARGKVKPEASTKKRKLRTEKYRSRPMDIILTFCTLSLFRPKYRVFPFE